MENNTQEKTAYTFDAFVPILIIAVSVLIFLMWNVAVLVRDLNNAMVVRTQQNMARAQAVGAEEQMKALMMELLGMSQADPDAKAIVDKYQIRFNAPAQQPGGPQPAAAKPAPKPAAPAARKPDASTEKPEPAASRKPAAAPEDTEAAPARKPEAN